MTSSTRFVGGRLDSMIVLAGTPADTSSGSFDSAYADAALRIGGSDELMHWLYDSSMAPVAVAAGATLWTHFEIQKQTGGSNGDARDLCVWYDSSGHPWAKLIGSGGSNYQVRYNSGSGGSPAWTQMGTYVTVSGREIIDVSLYIDSGGSHVIDFYLNGTLQAAVGGAFTASGLTNVAAVHWLGSDSGGCDISQVMVVEGVSTIDGKVPYSRATGAGSHTDWTGAYTLVNEPTDDDTTYDTIDTAGQIQTYAMGNITVAGGHVVDTVMHWMRAKATGGIPANIKSVCHQAGTDHVSGNLSGMGASFSAVGMRYDVDPNTSAAWTQTGYNAPVNFGYESAT